MISGNIDGVLENGRLFLNYWYVLLGEGLESPSKLKDLKSYPMPMAFSFLSCKREEQNSWTMDNES